MKYLILLAIIVSVTANDCSICDGYSAELDCCYASLNGCKFCSDGYICSNYGDSYSYCMSNKLIVNNNASKPKTLMQGEWFEFYFDRDTITNANGDPLESKFQCDEYQNWLEYYPSHFRLMGMPPDVSRTLHCYLYYNEHNFKFNLTIKMRSEVPNTFVIANSTSITFFERDYTTNKTSYVVDYDTSHREIEFPKFTSGNYISIKFNKTLITDSYNEFRTNVYCPKFWPRQMWMGYDPTDWRISGTIPTDLKYLQCYICASYNIETRVWFNMSFNEVHNIDRDNYVLYEIFNNGFEGDKLESVKLYDISNNIEIWYKDTLVEEDQEVSPYLVLKFKYKFDGDFYWVGNEDTKRHRVHVKPTLPMERSLVKYIDNSCDINIQASFNYMYVQSDSQYTIFYNGKLMSQEMYLISGDILTLRPSTELSGHQQIKYITINEGTSYIDLIILSDLTYCPIWPTYRSESKVVYIVIISVLSCLLIALLMVTKRMRNINVEQDLSVSLEGAVYEAETKL